jgi:hypothetical protein
MMLLSDDAAADDGSYSSETSEVDSNIEYDM